VTRAPTAARPSLVWFPTPWGRMAAAATAKGLVRVVLPRQARGEEAGRGAPCGPAAKAHAALARREILEYLEGRRREFTVPVDLEGVPPFHRQVLLACGEIPYGRTVTYGQLAARVGRPRAARAVGQAMAGNPVPLVIPCHRVVASGGGLGGYGGGLDLKRRLLALESSGGDSRRA